jgi:hypothetical protein
MDVTDDMLRSNNEEDGTLAVGVRLMKAQVSKCRQSLT